MNIGVGDIVCATYGKFDGENAVGIFLIIYDEKRDRIYSSGHSNVVAAKITTNNFMGDSYTVRLYEGDGGLDKSSLINLSKLHTFTRDQIYKKLGTLRPDIMLRVFKELRNFNNEVEAQIMENI